MKLSYVQPRVQYKQLDYNCIRFVCFVVAKKCEVFDTSKLNILKCQVYHLLVQIMISLTKYLINENTSQILLIVKLFWKIFVDFFNTMKYNIYYMRIEM